MIRYADKNAPSAGRRSPDHVHKFAVGARVLHQIADRPDPDVFIVVRQMPENATGFQYRIKSDSNGQERVVGEAEMRSYSAKLARARSGIAVRAPG